MNRRRLAAKIRESASTMRSKIEVNEYKDYILGFISYKYLSDREGRFFKRNTCNLMRMNLVMRGILPDDTSSRNADTLEEIRRNFEDSDSIRTYNPLHVDAVVSNPPYSQAWNPAN